MLSYPIRGSVKAIVARVEISNTQYVNKICMDDDKDDFRRLFPRWRRVRPRVFSSTRNLAALCPLCWANTWLYSNGIMIYSNYQYKFIPGRSSADQLALQRPNPRFSRRDRRSEPPRPLPSSEHKSVNRLSIRVNMSERRRVRLRVSERRFRPSSNNAPKYKMCN